MISQIYRGKLTHSRLDPIKHTFTYPVYFCSFDLSQLSKLDRTVNLFGYNKIRPVAIHDRDYLGDAQGSIQTKLMSFLSQWGCSDDIESINLVTVPRYLNYVFNPVSFFYCYRANGSLRCVVTEINNTYNETHLYILDRPLKASRGFIARYRIAKEFFVSPFNNLQGNYEFNLSEISDRIDIHINLLRDKKEVFLSRLYGEAMPLTSANLSKTLLEYPLSATLAMPRITWQALILKYRKGMKPYLKPKPTSPMTIRTAPDHIHQQISRQITALKQKVRRKFR